MRAVLFGALVICGLELGASSALARRLENWPYERLFKEADLIVIAQATAAEDCRERDNDNPWKVEFLGVNTTLKINAVVKGKPGSDTVTVLHFRLTDGQLIADGPLLVSFRTKGIALDLKKAQVELGRPEYMLFLKAGKDGRYEPVSGRIDPELSVREMHAPLPDVLDKGARR
jgi:hypothetical protein